MSRIVRQFAWRFFVDAKKSFENKKKKFSRMKKRELKRIIAFSRVKYKRNKREKRKYWLRRFCWPNREVDTV
jgi:hypothetical protein